MTATPNSLSTRHGPCCTKDKNIAAKYLMSVIELPEYPYAVMLMDIYENGFMTSVGFKQWIEIPAEPVSISETDSMILMNAESFEALPVDFTKYHCLFSNNEQILLDAVDPLFDALLCNHRIDSLQRMTEIDFSTPAFVASDGSKYKWCLLVY